MRRVALGFTLSLLAGACGQGTTELRINPTLSHSFEPILIAEGQEVSGLCQSWTLGNEETLYVAKIRQRNGGAWHDSNWFFVPEDTYQGPDGTWDCDEREFHDVTAALAGGVFFAQSTQTFEEIQAF